MAEERMTISTFRLWSHSLSSPYNVARMTVFADHGAPVGVGTPPALSWAAAARAEISRI
jgi:hypothetical protein